MAAVRITKRSRAQTSPEGAVRAKRPAKNINAPGRRLTR